MINYVVHLVERNAYHERKTVQRIGNSQKFPTKYVAEFRKHFKGFSIKATNNITFARTPTQHKI